MARPSPRPPVRTDVTVRVTHAVDSGGQSFFDTEMLAMDLVGPAFRLRESPTLPSRGQTTVRPVPGGYMLSSFFDVNTEVSTDGGVSWLPGQQPGHVELRPDPNKVEPIGAPTSLLPPPNDQYVSPQEWHALYAQGIVIKDVRHKFFTDSQPPPPTGGTTPHAFSSQLDLQVSTDGGSTFWNQIKADVLNVPYQRLVGNEFGAWGAAMIAGKAAGLINDLASYAEETALLNGKPFHPIKENHEGYLPLIEKYIKLEQTLNQFYRS